ncbi:hypothetical protein chiPu_0010931 [Chiloscyllium punctatum]|uniref:Uncharacterized protein n=1 Tax=Chiloscyllium punctatum TaxID=137246 RepID=A0A401SQ10_CHIPU|nr:hypothetical protein [Chiloscyllium punctatum]
MLNEPTITACCIWMVQDDKECPKDGSVQSLERGQRAAGSELLELQLLPELRETSRGLGAAVGPRSRARSDIRTG